MRSARLVHASASTLKLKTIRMLNLKVVPGHGDTSTTAFAIMLTTMQTVVRPWGCNNLVRSIQERGCKIFIEDTSSKSTSNLHGAPAILIACGEAISGKVRACENRKSVRNTRYLVHDMRRKYRQSIIRTIGRLFQSTNAGFCWPENDLPLNSTTRNVLLAFLTLCPSVQATTAGIAVRRLAILRFIVLKITLAASTRMQRILILLAMRTARDTCQMRETGDIPK